MPSAPAAGASRGSRTASAKYFDALAAPRKELVWFEESAHLPNNEERDKFNAFMIDAVLPVARRPARGYRATSVPASPAADV